MTRVIVDDSLRAKLHNLAEPLVLCDPQGQVFGHFVPAADMSEWEPVSPVVTDEELDRRGRSNERRYSTTEVLRVWRVSLAVSSRDVPCRLARIGA